MKTKTIYLCDICNAEYSIKESAEECYCSIKKKKEEELENFKNSIRLSATSLEEAINLLKKGIEEYWNLNFKIDAYPRDFGHWNIPIKGRNNIKGYLGWKGIWKGSWGGRRTSISIQRIMETFHGFYIGDCYWAGENEFYNDGVILLEDFPKIHEKYKIFDKNNSKRNEKIKVFYAYKAQLKKDVLKFMKDDQYLLDIDSQIEELQKRRNSRKLEVYNTYEKIYLDKFAKESFVYDEELLNNLSKDLQINLPKFKENFELPKG